MKNNLEDYKNEFKKKTGLKIKEKYLFGDIVVVDDDLIGVIVKTWINEKEGEVVKVFYDVYVRSYNAESSYVEEEIKRYRVRHKELNKEELEYQNN